MMIKDEIQKQEGGDSSTNLQGKTITINQGINYTDAKEIALDVYKANLLQQKQRHPLIKKAISMNLSQPFHLFLIIPA